MSSKFSHVLNARLTILDSDVRNCTTFQSFSTSLIDLYTNKELDALREKKWTDLVSRNRMLWSNSKELVRYQRAEAVSDQLISEIKSSLSKSF